MKWIPRRFISLHTFVVFGDIILLCYRNTLEYKVFDLDFMTIVFPRPPHFETNIRRNQVAPEDRV